jgi:hypothetical protein
MSLELLEKCEKTLKDEICALGATTIHGSERIPRSKQTGQLQGNIISRHVQVSMALQYPWPLSPISLVHIKTVDVEREIYESGVRWLVSVFIESDLC